MKKLALYILILTSLIVQSCNKDDNYIPDVPVTINIPANDYRISALTSGGGAITISGGVAGIILYKKSSGQIVAYDRCSSFNPESKCAVNITSPSTIATDPCSGSIFNLEDGSSIHAPATRPLKQYLVTVTSSQITVIN